MAPSALSLTPTSLSAVFGAKSQRTVILLNHGYPILRQFSEVPGSNNLVRNTLQGL